MKQISIVRTIVFLTAGSMIQAASTWTGNPLAYQPATTRGADAQVQEIRSRALSGQLTVEDVLRAAAEIKAVQENAPAAASAADSPLVPSSQTVPPDPVTYTRSETDFQLPIKEQGYPLSSSQLAQVEQVLDQVPLKHLAEVQDIQISPPVRDPDRGRLLVRTQGNSLSIFGLTDLQTATREGVASIVYDSMSGSPLGEEWQKYGDYGDFVQTYDDWMENTKRAFENARQSEHPSEELSKLFFMASLFGDPTSDQIIVYDPAPHKVAWMVKEGGHYGFGPYTFDVDHNQITHLAYSGSPITSSAADIPSLWTRQGLGN